MINKNILTINDLTEVVGDKCIRYYKILSKEFPNWLFDYINCIEIKRLLGTGMVCGTNYSPIFNYKSENNTFMHSIGCALIVWNFTKDKKQTIAALFHDIATPIFKHVIDFMNGDSKTQESTEERTEYIIRNSKRIMELLKRDGIKVEEVSNYHIYPICDNDTPRLSSDRLEYSLSNNIFLYERFSLDDVRKYYTNLSVFENEDGVGELGFMDINVAKEFIIKNTVSLTEYHSDNNRTVMQFLAEIVRTLIKDGDITIDDLYELSESDVLKKIENSNNYNLKENYRCFKMAKVVYKSNIYLEDKFCVNVVGKRRYIIPLVKCNEKYKRIVDIDNEIKELIKTYLKTPNGEGYYTYFDFQYRK